LTTSVSPAAGGTVTASPTSANGYYSSGTSVELTATANPGYRFSGWSGALTGSVNPQSLVMSAPRIVTALFAVLPTAVATNPAGLAIVVDGISLTAPQAFSWTPGTVHSIGTTSPQQSGTTRYVFAAWSDGGAQTHSITVSPSVTTYTASFTTNYQLIASASPATGGTVTASPASPDGYYTSGSSVQLSATANPGYRFSGWSGDLTGSVSPQPLVMSAPRNVIALFSLLPTAVATNPGGLAIVVDGIGQTAPQAFSWTPGTVHSIGVSSPQQSGTTRYVFAAWSDGGAQTHSITVSPSVTTYTASFTTNYQLIASASPAAGGTVTASPASPDGYYSVGSSVQLTATANPGYRFSGWSGDLTGSANPQSLVMSAPRNVTAVFSASGPLIYNVLDSASARPAIAPNSFVTIYGSNFTSWTGDWASAIQDGVLPTVLGGVQVRIDGKDCFINYVSSGQLNVLTPFDTVSGSVPVEVVTAQGTATGTAVMAPVAPALFGYPLSGRFYAVAQIATNMSIIVAPVGTFPNATSRPAQAGDYLALWALGMGDTDPAAPVGRVLTAAYPVSDLSQVKVKFGSLDAPVSWAGLVMAGLFQVNVLVPAGLSGDQPVVITVDGHSTQPDAFLTFQ
jgi:uncharacterized protein (TIGR03437 family)